VSKFFLKGHTIGDFITLVCLIDVVELDVGCMAFGMPCMAGRVPAGPVGCPLAARLAGLGGTAVRSISPDAGVVQPAPACLDPGAAYKIDVEPMIDVDSAVTRPLSFSCLVTRGT
jgi:hypothetical protein